MTLPFNGRQALTIARIEVRRAFLSRRSFWVYLLALLPSVIFVGHAIEVRVRQGRMEQGRKVSAAQLDSIRTGATAEAVLARLGEPASERTFHIHLREDGEQREVEIRRLSYADGKRQADLRFREGTLDRLNIRRLISLEEDTRVYAGMFQLFYLRLAIFFGCLGIFMNLFRGEMIDKTLHFWLLAPARRETLLLGKYLAGLAAALAIFGAGALVSFCAMLWPQEAGEVAAYWNNGGAAHLARYLGAAACACLGYGSIFLAAGLLLRNPIIPAAVMLLWENINGFLPAFLQKASVLYYVQSLCPIPPPIDAGAPAIVKLIFAPADPAAPWAAALGIAALTVAVLAAAVQAVRRLEINYSTD